MSTTQSTPAAPPPTAASASKTASSGEQPAERDPRVALLKWEILYADLSDELQAKVIDITIRAIEKHVLFPTRVERIWRKNSPKDFDREVERTAMRDIAATIKKDVDKALGPCWHVVYGRGFAGFVTHERMCFLHFRLDGADVMVWKHGA